VSETLTVSDKALARQGPGKIIEVIPTHSLQGRTCANYNDTWRKVGSDSGLEPADFKTVNKDDSCFIANISVQPLLGELPH
jgi:hypothetical protein